ncbi:MAG: hypothetical protein OER22_14105 [Gammaproteobacteria bacterium]|nr:hypothetical protein [Gammaproteobacteria bacterium]MDH3553743.1 hypothetical protein [Gammaproteobacteria bacterium]
MIRQGALAIIFFIITACSGTGPQASDPAGYADTSVGKDAAAAAEPQATDGEEVDMRILAEDSAQDDMVCRRDKPIGSNIGKRVCRSRSGESARSEADREMLRKVQDLSDDDRKVSGN